MCKIINKKGQTTLEFVMLLPFVFVMILAVSQFAYIAHIQNKLTQASREGARIITLTNSDEEMRKTVLKSLSGLERDKLIIETTPSEQTERSVGGVVDLRISYMYDGFLGLLDVFSKDGVKIEGLTSMVMECN
jgi:hypothetical protein